MKKILIILGAVILVLILGILLLFILARKATPPQIVANIVDVDKIEKISKYRSCAGHTTVPQNEREMKRSMKHYFSVKPEYRGDKMVEIYAPYNGFVTVSRQDQAEGLEGEIWIVPDDKFVMFPPIDRWMFSVQHINIREGLKRGSKVKSGELIGYGAVSANRSTFDVIYGKGAIKPKMIDNWNGPFSDLDSVFNQMSADVLAQYRGNKINSKEDFIITQEERAEDPCVYKDNGPYFINQDDSKNWVAL